MASRKEIDQQIFKEKLNFNVTDDNYIKTSDYSLSIKKKFLIHKKELLEKLMLKISELKKLS